MSWRRVLEPARRLFCRWFRFDGTLLIVFERVETFTTFAQNALSAVPSQLLSSTMLAWLHEDEWWSSSSISKKSFPAIAISPCDLVTEELSAAAFTHMIQFCVLA